LSSRKVSFKEAAVARFEKEITYRVSTINGIEAGSSSSSDDACYSDSGHSSCASSIDEKDKRKNFMSGLGLGFDIRQVL